MKRGVVVVLAGALLGGCGTTATIYRVNAPASESHIIGGTPGAIVVRDEGGEYAIPRSDIRDIDHPGDGAIGTGTGVLAYGLLNIAVGAPDCSDHQAPAAYCSGVFLPAALGLGMLIWGLAVHHGSTAAADDRSLVLPASTAWPAPELLPRPPTAPAPAPTAPVTAPPAPPTAVPAPAPSAAPAPATPSPPAPPSSAFPNQ